MIIAASKPVKVPGVLSTPAITTKTVGGKATPPPTTPVPSQPTTVTPVTSNPVTSSPVTTSPPPSTPTSTNNGQSVSSESKKDFEYYLKKFWYIPAGLTAVFIMNRKFKWF